MCTVYLEDFFHLNSGWASFSLAYGTQGIQCVPSSTTTHPYPPDGFLFVLILVFLLIMYMVHLNSCWTTFHLVYGTAYTMYTVYLEDFFHLNYGWASFSLVYGTQGIQCVPSSTTTYLLM